MSGDFFIELGVRCLLVVLFLPFSALDKIINFRGAVAQAKQKVPSQSVAVTLILAGMGVEIIMSLGVVTGIADRLAAFLLSGYCVMTALLWKQFWMSGDFWRTGESKGRNLFWDFLKNISLAGGFLLITFGTTDMTGHAFFAHPLASSEPYVALHPRQSRQASPSASQRLSGGRRCLIRRQPGWLTLHCLQSLEITAVELMPVHWFVQDKYLVDQQLTNYWGYNSIGFFAPEARYASARGPGQEVSEFKTMVKALHGARIEVILDVVYNHTAEGNQLGPTLCFRGIDNASYYQLVPESRRYYRDYARCGNSPNMMHPRILQLIMDSLCNPEMRCVGERLAGDAIEATDEHASRIVDDTLLMLLNAHYESVPFILPAHRTEQRWELVLDTQEPSGRREPSPALEDDRYVVAPRSLVMLRITTHA